MVGVFRVEMAMSFRSSGVGLNAGIFGQFRKAQVGLETAFGWSYLCVICVSWVVQNELLKFFINPCELILVLLP